MRKYMKDNAAKIRQCVPFEADSIKGEWYSSTAYVIYSYTTPIAIYSNGYWYLTTQKYSLSTTKQQHALRLILADKDTVAMSPDMFASQFKALSGLPAPH